MPSIFSKPAKYSATVTNVVYLTPETLKVDLQVGGIDFTFLPGQFITVKVAVTKFRSYSLLSDYKSPSAISLILTDHKPGIGTNFLASLKLGDSIEFIGPSGRFTLSEPPKPNILFVVTSTGVVPILSMLERLKDLKCESKIILYFGLRTEGDVFCVSELENYKAALNDFSYFICISEPTLTGVKIEKNILHGRVTNFYKLPDLTSTQVYVCGNPLMVADVLEQLKAKGFPDDGVFHEKFVLSKN